MILPTDFNQAFSSFLLKEAEEIIFRSSQILDEFSVELFRDGTYRVLLNNSIGNRYVSSGIIVSIPKLDIEDELADTQEDCFFDTALEYLQAIYEEVIKDFNMYYS